MSRPPRRLPLSAVVASVRQRLASGPATKAQLCDAADPGAQHRPAVEGWVTLALGEVKVVAVGVGQGGAALFGVPPVSNADDDAASATAKIEAAGGLDALEGAHLVGESEEALAAEAAATLPAPAPDDSTAGQIGIFRHEDSEEPPEGAEASEGPQAPPPAAEGAQGGSTGQGGRPVSALAAHLHAIGHTDEAREIEGLPPAPKPPGPSSRCAVCGVAYARHGQHPDDGEVHPFAPKPRGAPRGLRSPRVPVAPPAPADALAGLPGGAVDDEGGDLPTAAELAPMVAEVRGEQAAPPSGPFPREQREARALYHALKAAPPVRLVTEDGSPGNPMGVVYMAPEQPAPRCAPPGCHYLSIHDPARVVSFAAPLCARHRVWVERAGGSARHEPREETV